MSERMRAFYRTIKRIMCADCISYRDVGDPILAVLKGTIYTCERCGYKGYSRNQVEAANARHKAIHHSA